MASGNSFGGTVGDNSFGGVVDSTSSSAADQGRGAHGEGLRVKIQSIAGKTPKGVLESGYYFQCPPLEEFSVDYAHSHTDYDTVLEGQFSRKGGVQLRSAQFSTLVVDWGLFTVAQDTAPIEELTATLIEVCEAGDPFLLTVAHRMPAGGFDNWGASMAGPELQMAATLRTLRVTERAGEGDARYMDVAFTEYRDPQIRSRQLKKKRGQKTTRSGDRPFPITVELIYDGWSNRGGGFPAQGTLDGRDLSNKYRIPGPVTLISLAARYYGDPQQWRQIAVENGLGDWGAASPLHLHPRFVGPLRGTVIVPRIFAQAITDTAAGILGLNQFTP